MLTVKEKLELFSKYLGKPLWIKSLFIHQYSREVQHQVGILKGVNEHAIEVQLRNEKVWIPVTDDAFKYYEYKLLLNPLSRLTDDIIATANNLPITVFIKEYYLKLGFDMPVFICPEHKDNCKTMAELELADYRLPQEILMLNTISADDHSKQGVLDFR